MYPCKAYHCDINVERRQLFCNPHWAILGPHLEAEYRELCDSTTQLHIKQEALIALFKAHARRVLYLKSVATSLETHFAAHRIGD